MTACARCNRVTGHYWLVDGQELCDDCYPLGRVNGSLSKLEKIKSRVRMPDGKVIQGFAGQKMRDNVLRAQDKSKT